MPPPPPRHTPHRCGASVHLLAGVEDQAGAQRKAEKDAEAAKRYATVGRVGGQGVKMYWAGGGGGSVRPYV